MNIGFISYFVAFAAYSALLVLLVFSWRGRQFGSLVILATACTAAWAAVSAASALVTIQLPPMTIQAFELVKDSAWCLFLFKTVNHHDDNNAALDSTRLATSSWKALFLGGFSLAVFLLFIVPLIIPYSTLPLRSEEHTSELQSR